MGRIGPSKWEPCADQFAFLLASEFNPSRIEEDIHKYTFLKILKGGGRRTSCFSIQGLAIKHTLSVITRVNVEMCMEDIPEAKGRILVRSRLSRRNLCESTRPTESVAGARAGGRLSSEPRTRGCRAITRIVYAGAPRRYLTRWARGSSTGGVQRMPRGIGTLSRGMEQCISVFGLVGDGPAMHSTLK